MYYNYDTYQTLKNKKLIDDKCSALDFQVISTNDKIKKIILDGKPAIVGRLGGMDFNFFNSIHGALHHLNIFPDIPNLDMNNIYTITGYFDKTTNKDEEYNNIKKYYYNAMNSYKNSDLLMACNADLLDAANFVYYFGELNPDRDYKDKEFTILNELKNIDFVYHSFEQLNYLSYNGRNFMTDIFPLFEGKKILVISPFADEIELQYKNNKDKLFENFWSMKGLKYPNFELKTIKTIITYSEYKYRLETDYLGYNNWFEYYEGITAQIKNLDFDIALLGCGSVSTPLLYDIKYKYNKIGIYCGGVLQIFFGILGNRYKYLETLGLINETWIHPNINDTSIVKYTPDNATAICKEFNESIYSYIYT